MKKIATITFHWAKNYGAVLQAFALQKYLKKLGFETEILDYVPFRTMILDIVLAIKKGDFAFFRRVKKFKKFRKNELSLSKKKFYNNKSLFKVADKYLAIITGSDQVWNKSFTKRGEGKPTLSYYLNFAKDKTKRISYATSFGTNKLDEEMKKLIKPELKKFSSISVREKDSVSMLDEIGIHSQTVVDPTLLLLAQDYEILADKSKDSQCEDVFVYILHSNQITAENISNYICEKIYKCDCKNITYCDVYQWIKKIKSSKFVVTNSFHGTVFSLIFHKPFLTVEIPKSGMNSRLTTLLKDVSLEERFVNEFNINNIDLLLKNEINWEEVDRCLSEKRVLSQRFLEESLQLIK